MIREFQHRFFLVAFGIAISVVIAETILHIYSPFEFRVKGNRIILPSHKEYVIENDGKWSKLDRRIVHRKNSLGFRGDEPPADFDDHLTIVTVGGSTTECFYLSDGKTWPDRLGDRLTTNFSRLWINNAGLDGHSTFGHSMLLQQHLGELSPDILIFLIGLNDVGIGRARHQDLQYFKDGLSFKSGREFVKSLANYSELTAIALNLYRYYRAYDMGATYRGQLDIESAPRVVTPPEERARIRAEHRDQYISAYRKRLLEIIELARSRGIEPVLVTHPALYGPTTDDVTGVDLAMVNPYDGVDGALAWEILEFYNQVARSLAKEQDVLVVDLARILPKSSRLYYDFTHYTNEGSDEIADILLRELCPFLWERFPTHVSVPHPTLEELNGQSGTVR